MVNMTTHLAFSCAHSWLAEHGADEKSRVFSYNHDWMLNKHSFALPRTRLRLVYKPLKLSNQ